MAAEVLTRYSEETMRRLEYESRIEDRQLYNNKIAAFNKRLAESDRQAEEFKRKAAESDRIIADLKSQLAAMTQAMQDNG